MRTLDRTPPTIPAHTIPPEQPSARWPAKPVVGLEWVAQSTWDSAKPAAVYDNTNPEQIYDDPESALGFTDVWCDTTGLEIVHGEPDEHELFPPSRATLTLYDPNGKYARRTPDGQLVYFAPGRRLACLAQFDATPALTFPGTAGNYLRCADSPALDVTSDLCVILRGHDLNAASYGALAWKGNTSTAAGTDWEWYVGPTMTTHSFAWVDPTAPTTRRTISVGAMPALSAYEWWAFTFNGNNGAGGRTFRVWRSADGVNWTVSATTTQATGVTTIRPGTFDLHTMDRPDGTLPIAGTVRSFAVYNGIGNNSKPGLGTKVAEFDAARYGAGTAFVDPYGNTWTIVGPAHTWTTIPTDSWWLFSGHIAEWHELPNGFVEIVAYTDPSYLAQHAGPEWTAGSNGDTIRPRVNAIVAASGVVGVTVRADLGDATLMVPEVARVSPWEAIQRAVWSDAGVVFSDADDTLIVRDRRWRQGRDDQPVPPLVVTDNVCVAGNTVVWDLQSANVDDYLAARVTLENADPNPDTVTASAATEVIDPNLTYTHPDTDLWRTPAEGQAVAQQIANDRGTVHMAIGLARVLLHDPRRQTRSDWLPVIDLRLGDRVGWQHETDNLDGSVTLVDVDVIAATVRHLITPETWTVELETTPAVGYRVVHEWNTTLLEWDTADVTGVWR